MPGVAAALGLVALLLAAPESTAVDPGRPPVLVRVHLEAAVRQMMEESTWNGKLVTAMPGKIRDAFVTRALGRAAAHEIGHYLLASKAHARSGLMRDRMTPGEIMRADHREDHLDPSEVERLRGTLLRYARQRRPSVSDPAASDPHRSGW